LLAAADYKLSGDGLTVIIAVNYT